MEKKTLKFIDLFAGLGGIRLGFEEAAEKLSLDVEWVFSSDIKPAAIKAYEHNFKVDDVYHDITKVQANEIPDFDYMLAGFPCQPFSQAGIGLGFEDTRGTLFFDVARILDEKKPKGFLLENVEGLVGHDHGNTLRVIMKTLRNLGYHAEYTVLDAQYFGLAQSRKRVYIVGSLLEDVDIEDFPVTQTTLNAIIDKDVPGEQSDFTTNLLKHYKMEDVYGKSIKDKRGGSNNIHSWDIELKGSVTKEEHDLLEKLLTNRRKKEWAQVIGIDWMDGMPLTTSQIRTFYDADNLQEMLDDLSEKGYIKYEYPKKLENRRRVYDETKPKGYNIVTGKLSFEYSKILDPNSVAPTLVATDVSHLGVPTSDTEIRQITTKEGQKLFGFPEDYDLSILPKPKVFDLLGNTVCIPVIKAVAERVLAIQ